MGEGEGVEGEVGEVGEGEVGEGEGVEGNLPDEPLEPEEDNEPDLWEETFKSFKDSKPYGESCLFVCLFAYIFLVFVG